MRILLSVFLRNVWKCTLLIINEETSGATWRNFRKNYWMNSQKKSMKLSKEYFEKFSKEFLKNWRNSRIAFYKLFPIVLDWIRGHFLCFLPRYAPPSIQQTWFSTRTQQSDCLLAEIQDVFFFSKFRRHSLPMFNRNIYWAPRGIL